MNCPELFMWTKIRQFFISFILSRWLNMINITSEQSALFDILGTYQNAKGKSTEHH